MDCNKEEAVKAKNLAEEKLKAGDYVGAHGFVTEAQRLFPDLENIPQMIAICDVHSSADKKLNGLNNWYGIFQVQPFSDSNTIKKQYRKLAFLLHPDKNKFAGAEAAFKLVNEANRCLSDTIKRSQYDSRYISHSAFALKHSVANPVRNGAAAKNPPDKISSDYTFWTCCQNCGHKCKYLKEYINKLMRCSACKKSYIAFNMGDERVPLSSSIAGEKGIQNQEKCSNASSRRDTSKEPESESSGSTAELNKNGTLRGKLNKKNQENQKKSSGKRKSTKNEDSLENEAEIGNPQKGMNISAEIPKADVLKRQPEVKETETCTAEPRSCLAALEKNQAAKKRTKTVEESSKSSEDVAGDKTDTKSGCEFERGSDGDFVSPPTKKAKSGCEFEPDSNIKQMAEDNKSHEVSDAGVSCVYVENSKKNVDSGNEYTLSAKNKESEGCHSNGQDAECSSKIDKVEEGYKANVSSDTLHEADPKFNVFEADPENFAVDQVWSIRDSRDGMPRKYVQVKKVLTTVFKLLIAHLEHVDDMNDENIPFACEKFRQGKTEEVEDLSIFSCKMHSMFCKENVFIYPKKGEIWAIFRDWSEEWDTSLEKHKLPYKYDFVEVLSDFDDELGLGAAYLGKLKGFVTRFHWENQYEICKIQFRPEEILRFSHKVPSLKVTGEKNDLYELDRAALPEYILQVDADDVEMDSDILRGEAENPCPEPVPKTAQSPRKLQEPDVANGISSNLGEAKSRSSTSHNFSSCKVDEMNTVNKSRKSCEASDVIKLRKSPRLNTLRRKAFDFKKQRSRDKLQVNQVWAIYCIDTKMPSEYVKIRKIETKPKLMLHVTHMAPHPPSTNSLTRPMSCGDLKLKSGRPKILQQDRLSHQVKHVHHKNTIVKVHPRKGEIWALFKNRDSTKEEQDIVEVVEDYEDGEIAKAVALTAKRADSLYIMEKKLGSNASFREIPKAEMSRFSHQIPAMRHEKKTTKLVADGYWELDLAAIPSNIIA